MYMGLGKINVIIVTFSHDGYYGFQVVVEKNYLILVRTGLLGDKLKH